MSRNTVEILEQNKTVSITDDGKEVLIDSASIQVVSVGIQGPAGSAQIAGKGVSTDSLTDGDLLKYSSTTDVWEFTQVIDAGTF